MPRSYLVIDFCARRRVGVPPTLNKGCQNFNGEWLVCPFKDADIRHTSNIICSFMPNERMFIERRTEQYKV